MNAIRLFALTAGLLVLSSAATAEDREVRVFNRSIKDMRSLWVAEYEKGDLGGKAKLVKGPWKIRAGARVKFDKKAYRTGYSRHIRWLKHDDFPNEYSNSEWRDINSRKGIGVEKNHVYLTDVDEKGKYEGFYWSGWKVKGKEGKYMTLILAKQIEEELEDANERYRNAFDRLENWDDEAVQHLEEACQKKCRDEGGDLVDKQTCRNHCKN